MEVDAEVSFAGLLPESLRRRYSETESGIYSAPRSTFEPTLLDFSRGQPDCFFEGEGNIPYRGQDAAKKRLSLHIAALQPGERLKALLTGPAGTGKTTLARIIADKIQTRHLELGLAPGGYWELSPAQITEKVGLDECMRLVASDAFTTVFIDEVHTLTNLENLFYILHDTGESRFPLASGAWLPIPPTISWIAATTDPGLLDTTTGGALRRRLEPEIRLTAPGSDVLAGIVTDQALADGLSISPVAARHIGLRSVFPWQAKLIYAEARKVTLVAGREYVSIMDTLEAFDLMELDEHGLQREDRDIIETLLSAPYRMATKAGGVKYKMGEEALCAAAGVDRQTYKKRIQPKLFQRGLLTTTGGQCLTDKAVQLFGGRMGAHSAPDVR